MKQVHAYILYHVIDKTHYMICIAAEDEREAYTTFHARGKRGWFRTDEIPFDGKVRLMKKDTPAGPIYIIQKKCFFLFWKTLNFNNLDWFSDERIAIENYLSVTTSKPVTIF